MVNNNFVNENIEIWSTIELVLRTLRLGFRKNGYTLSWTILFSTILLSFFDIIIVIILYFANVSSSVVLIFASSMAFLSIGFIIVLFLVVSIFYTKNLNKLKQSMRDLHDYKFINTNFLNSIIYEKSENFINSIEGNLSNQVQRLKFFKY